MLGPGYFRVHGVFKARVVFRHSPGLLPVLGTIAARETTVPRHPSSSKGTRDMDIEELKAVSMSRRPALKRTAANAQYHLRSWACHGHQRGIGHENDLHLGMPLSVTLRSDVSWRWRRAAHAVPGGSYRSRNARRMRRTAVNSSGVTTPRRRSRRWYATARASSGRV
jgi:hypothetical protein